MHRERDQLAHHLLGFDLLATNHILTQLGNELEDGCMHSRACFGVATDHTSSCEAFNDKHGEAVNCEKSPAYAEIAGLTSCGQYHWDYFQ